MMPETSVPIVPALETTRDELDALLATIPANHALLRLHPDSWSILDVIEHLVIVERLSLRRLSSVEPSEARPRDTARERELMARAQNRTAKILAPERVRPAARFTAAHEARQAFLEARAQTIRFAQERGAALSAIPINHPVFGPITGAESLILIAAHTRRHIAQIGEIASAISPVRGPA
jgi:uncharacterized damage-inducible protein DinB